MFVAFLTTLYANPSQVDSTLTQRMMHSPKEKGSLGTGYLQTLQLWLVNRPPKRTTPPPEIAG